MFDFRNSFWKNVRPYFASWYRQIVLAMYNNPWLVGLDLYGKNIIAFSRIGASLQFVLSKDPFPAQKTRSFVRSTPMQ